MRALMKNKRAVPELSLEEALNERRALVAEVSKVQQQLGDRNIRLPDGSRMSSKEYWDWHRKATAFVRMTHDRLAEIKEHVRQLRLKVTADTAGVQDTSDYGLLVKAYQVLNRLKDEVDDFDPDEDALLVLLRNRVQGVALKRGHHGG